MTVPRSSSLVRAFGTDVLGHDVLEMITPFIIRCDVRSRRTSGHLTQLINNGDSPMKRRIIFVLALLCAAVASLHNVHAETLTVTNANDDGPGSLRWEIRNARSGDTIIFSVRGNIRIRSQLNIHQSISIEGPGRDKLAVDAFNGHLRTLRVFFVSGNPTALEPFNVTISGLTIKEGTVMPDSTGGFGAGIYNDNANLTVNDLDLRRQLCCLRRWHL